MALSNAEAEFYALTKGAAQTLSMLSLLQDFGVELVATVHTDASAAIGIRRRKGLGKIRHLNVGSCGCSIRPRPGPKVPGLENLAGIMTKYLRGGPAALRQAPHHEEWRQGTIGANLGRPGGPARQSQERVGERRC